MPFLSPAASSFIIDSGKVALRIFLDIEFFDVPAVGIDFNRGQYLSALIIVPVGKLVAGSNGLHAHFVKQLLVMVGP